MEKEPVESHKMGMALSRQRSGPVETDKDVAQGNILNLVSCDCKAGCSTTCGCRKLGLHCTPMCSKCEGRTCTNIADTYDEDDNTDQL